MKNSDKKQTKNVMESPQEGLLKAFLLDKVESDRLRPLGAIMMLLFTLFVVGNGFLQAMDVQSLYDQASRWKKQTVQIDSAWRIHMEKINMKDCDQTIVSLTLLTSNELIAAMSYLENSAEIKIIKVEPSWQKRGIGGLLLDWGLQTYKDAGYLNATLKADPLNDSDKAEHKKNLERLVRFYTLHGGEIVDECLRFRPHSERIIFNL